MHRLDQAGQVLAVAALDLDTVVERGEPVALSEGLTDLWRGSPDARVQAHWFPQAKLAKE